MLFSAYSSQVITPTLPMRRRSSWTRICDNIYAARHICADVLQHFTPARTSSGLEPSQVASASFLAACEPFQALPTAKLVPPSVPAYEAERMATLKAARIPGHDGLRFICSAAVRCPVGSSIHVMGEIPAASAALNRTIVSLLANATNVRSHS